MPETAVFVMGAFTMPSPTPKTTKITTSRPRAVWLARKVSATPLTATQAPATSSGSRGPREPTIRPESGAKKSAIAAIGTRYRPAPNALNPPDVLKVQRVQEQEASQRGERANGNQ